MENLRNNQPSFNEPPRNPEQQEQLPPTVEERITAIADRLKPEQQETLYRATAAYGMAVEKVEQTSIQEMHKLANRAPDGYDSYVGERHLNSSLDRHFQALDTAATTQQPVEEIAARYGLNATPKDSFAKIRQDDAKRRLNQGATQHHADYKQSKRQQAATLLEEKAGASTPSAPNPEDQEAAANIGVDDLDNRLHARLDVIETALNSVVPQTAGRAILRKLSVKKDWVAQSADFDVTKAAHDLEGEIRESGRSPWVTEEARTAIKGYMKDNGLMQPGKEEYTAFISEVVAEIGPTITADEAKSFIKDKLESTTVPELKMFGLVKDPNKSTRKNQSTGFTGNRFGTPFDDLIDDLLNGRFNTGDQRSNYSSGNTGASGNHDRVQTPPGREQSVVEREVISEIDRLRAEGVPENKIKQQLLKKYRDPTGQNDDPRAKVVSDKFRPKNSHKHYGA